MTLDWQTKRALRTVIEQDYLGRTTINTSEFEKLFERVINQIDNSKEDIKTKFKLFNEFVAYILNRNRANYDSMLLVSGDKGCLTDDTLIMMPRDIKKYPEGVPIKDLLGKGQIYVYCFNRDTKKLEIKLSDGAEFAKYADVYELELKNGQKIKATEDHPFMLMDGSYKKLKDLIWRSGKYNNIIYKNNRMELTDRLRLVIPKQTASESIKYDYNAIDKSSGDTLGKHFMAEHRFIASQIFGEFDRTIVVHHKDENHFNNNIDNIEILTQKEHTFKHQEQFFKKGNTYCYATGYTTSSKKKVVPVDSQEFRDMVSKERINYISNNYKTFKESMKNNGKTTSYIVNGGVIKNITYLGKQNVYDIVNVRDNHNFIANGFVVSNTGKSSFAIMFAKLWCKIIDIRFNPKKHIVYSNAQIVHAIDTLPMFHPIVCLTGTTIIRILTDDGEYKKVLLNTLVGKNNYKVLSLNIDESKFEYIKPKKTILTSKNATVYEIELQNGKKIRATENHKFLVEGGYKELKKLCIEDVMAVYNERDILIQPYGIGASKIKSIRKIKKSCKVYDIIGVGDNHNFIANDMVVHNCDEAIDFASAQNWNKRENKDLKIKLGKIRTKHMLFILCWPWKINRLDKIYFESYITYWIDLYTRGKGALFVKDKNPYNNPWKIDEFKDIGSFTEFSTEQDIQKLYSKHPNFWSLIFCKKPSAEFYARYLKVRESNVYNNSDVLDSTEQGDIYRAFIIKSFEDVYMKGSTKAFKRLQRHLQEMYKYTILEKDLKNIFDDANMLVEKILEKQGIELERKEQQMITDGISQ